MSELKQVARHGSIYAVANLANSGAGLVLIPLYTHSLTTTQFGVYAVIVALSDVLGLLIGAGMAKAMGRYYFEHLHDSSSRAGVVSTALLGFAGIGALVALCAYPLAAQIVAVVFGSGQYTALFALAVVAVVFAVLFEITTGYLVIRKRAHAFLLVSCAKAVLLLAANFLLVFHLGLGLWGIVVAMTLTLGVLSVVLAVAILARNGLRFSWPLFKRLLVFGFPLVPPAFAQAGIALTQRYLLTSFAGAGAAGTYALADRLASLLQVFLAGPFSQIFFVRRFESLAQGADQQEFREVLLIFVAVMATGGLALTLFAPEIVRLIAPPEYAAAAGLMPLLALCYVLSALNVNIEFGLFYSKNTGVISAIALATLTLTVLASDWLILWHGMLGAALAYVFVSAVRLVLTVAANRRYGSGHVTLDWMRAVPILVLGLALGWGGLLAAPDWKDVGARLAILAGFVALLATTTLLGKRGRELVRAAWRHDG